MEHMGLAWLNPVWWWQNPPNTPPIPRVRAGRQRARKITPTAACRIRPIIPPMVHAGWKWGVNTACVCRQQTMTTIPSICRARPAAQRFPVPPPPGNNVSRACPSAARHGCSNPTRCTRVLRENGQRSARVRYGMSANAQRAARPQPVYAYKGSGQKAAGVVPSISVP